MTEDDIAQVQESWRTIDSVKHIAAELFYVKLFELDPQLRLMYGDDLRLCTQKFTELMDATVRGLDRAEMLMPAIRELGIRHPTFGESDAHHGTVASALLWTLEKGLRKDFTPQIKSAWIKICGVLSQTLRSAALAQPMAANPRAA
jgi:hemoglobin-like flavoprotein